MEQIIRDYRVHFMAAGVLLTITVFLYFSSAVYFVMAGFDFQYLKPWSIFEVMYYSRDPLITSRLWVAFGLPGMAISFALFKSYELISGSNKNQYANARWANRRDLMKAGLIENDGLFLGKHNNDFIRCDKDSHVIVVAPTRAGKGVGVVIPNLLTWQGSVVCLDIKHENYEFTAGMRNRGDREVFMWAPGDTKRSDGFNPLDQIDTNPAYRIKDVRRIAGIMLPCAGRDIFWITEARSLFVGLALYVLDHRVMPSTFGSIYRLLSCENELGDICKHITKNYPDLPQEMISILNRFANKAVKERSGVKSTLDAAMQPWSEPNVDAATTKSSFQISELRKKQMSIYIGVKPDEIETMSGVLRIFFEFLINKMTADRPNPETEPHELLILLDEIHMLGKMEIMKNAFTLAAGFNCRVMAVVQQYSWLDDVYSKDVREGIVGNCANKVFFKPENMSQAKEISEMLGKRMVEMVSYSQKCSFKHEPRTKTVSLQEKPLMSADNILHLEDKEILFCKARHPVLCDKIIFHEDPAFKDRILPPPKVSELKFTTHELPKFDIENPPKKTGPKDNTDQGNLFEETPKDLDEGLNDKPEDDQEDGFLGSLGDNLN